MSIFLQVSKCFFPPHVLDFKDNKTSGMVSVIKEWEGGKQDNSLNIKVSTQKPTKSPLGFTVSFDSGEGVFPNGSNLNDIVYSRSGKIIKGDYIIPKSDLIHIEFDCWEKSNGDRVSLSDSGELLGGIVEDIEVSAKYKKRVGVINYGVCIYGIEEDVDRYGNALGITFGGQLRLSNIPNEVRDHTPSGVTDSMNAHRCIQSDDWSTICYWNEKDPYVYEQCIGSEFYNGCSKPLEIDCTKSPFIFIQDRSMTSYSINCLTSRNVNNDSSGYYLYSKEDKSGGTFSGWGGSYIRSKLNGDCDETVEVNSGVFSSDNCIFGCLPECVQENIGERKTIYSRFDSGSRIYDYCYDRLFVPSAIEIGKPVGNFVPDDGNCFSIFMGISDNTLQVSHEVGCSTFLTRSIGLSTSNDIYVVDSNVTKYSVALNEIRRKTLALVFCFSLQ